MTVTITGPAGLNAGATGTYTISATRASNPSSKMGINVAASTGTLGTNGAANLQVIGSELAHLGPNTNLVTTSAGGAGSYTFTYQMPAGAGGTASTLYGVARIAFAGGWRHAAALTVATRPAAPAIGTGTPGNTTASVAFTAPANGGSVITGYTATCGAFSNSWATSPITVSGLTNGTTYNCSVTATNASTIQAVGFAPAIPFESVIMISLPPGAYTAIVTGAGGTTGVGIIEVFAQ